MMIESKSNYPFIIVDTDRNDKNIQIKNYFYLIVLVLKVSKNLSLIMIKIYSTKYSMVLKSLIKKIIT